MVELLTLVKCVYLRKLLEMLYPVGNQFLLAQNVYVLRKLS